MIEKNQLEGFIAKLKNSGRAQAHLSIGMSSQSDVKSERILSKRQKWMGIVMAALPDNSLPWKVLIQEQVRPADTPLTLPYIWTITVVVSY